MTTPLLSCRRLTRRFGGVVALDGLDLEVEAASVLGLIGPNGSGKTTFFNVVTGLFPANAGEIRFAGAPITGLRPQAVHRAGIARTFQRSRLCLPLSIFDNLMVGNHQHLDHRLWFNLVRRQVLRRQIEENYRAARELLHIFDPPLADRMMEPAARIPMIDRRRVEVCRALISRPKLLLLDEPSAGMTHEETLRLMDDILEVQQKLGGLTIILIEHEMSVIERVTRRCVVLNYGRKIAEGAYAEVSRDPEVREAYLGLE
ncbi:MAG: ABC transporter ATP-binding protein [Chloroflexi bacterium 13_1_40CM_2_68_14]|nr:MAG: ABC transporter ATP-binding protein [Deltaproteobacteria bacterium 13_1_40CM_3_69_14]OLD48190.1 MAG: ABC transporter ATP-binding protein [Chloroflexi bacterium 13_1_40CM_2_68_14]